MTDQPPPEREIPGQDEDPREPNEVPETNQPGYRAPGVDEPPQELPRDDA